MLFQIQLAALLCEGTGRTAEDGRAVGHGATLDIVPQASGSAVGELFEGKKKDKESLGGGRVGPSYLKDPASSKYAGQQAMHRCVVVEGSTMFGIRRTPVGEVFQALFVPAIDDAWAAPCHYT